MRNRILLVDDDPSVTASLALLLKQAGYLSRTAAAPAAALERLAQEEFHLVIQDMNFSREISGAEGLALLGEIKRRCPGLPVILITAWGSISLAVEGVKRGAADFITKPWSNQQLLQVVGTALGLAESENTGRAPASRAELEARYDLEDVTGTDPRFLRVVEMALRVAPTDASVLITGESGSGKEVIASAIHRNSRRSRAPFVKVNLGGISSTLFESEMFGHVRGAFTDARQDRKGRFEVANGGTIFLDEIGELEPPSQVKILRVLQDRTYEVLGSSATRTLDVRVISATNRNLAGMVEKGEFREDLLYRLNLIALHLPPLRERRGDIRLLAGSFLANIGNVYRRAVSLTPAAVRWMDDQDWPGNIRQLKQLIERTVLLSGSDLLDAGDFAAAAGMERADAAREQLPEAGSMTMEEIEKTMIAKCLKRYAGNISQAAEALGMSRQGLYRRMEKHGIAP